MSPSKCCILGETRPDLWLAEDWARESVRGNSMKLGRGRSIKGVVLVCKKCAGVMIASVCRFSGGNRSHGRLSVGQGTGLIRDSGAVG